MPGTPKALYRFILQQHQEVGIFIITILQWKEWRRRMIKSLVQITQLASKINVTQTQSNSSAWALNHKLYGHILMTTAGTHNTYTHTNTYYAALCASPPLFSFIVFISHIFCSPQVFTGTILTSLWSKSYKMMWHVTGGWGRREEVGPILQGLDLSICVP